jgi:transcriptional regulator with XRE-family HTH domain
MRIRERLLKAFHDFKYRHAYVDEFTDAFIATQIKVIREQRGMNQTQLGVAAGMRQSQISELEDVNTRSWKVSTLKKIAKAFDLVLVVRFETFGNVLPSIGHLERTLLERAAFKDDPVFSTSTATATADAPSTDEHMPPGGLLLNAQGRFTGGVTAFSGQVSNVA